MACGPTRSRWWAGSWRSPTPYSALTEGRPYRPALSPGHALGQIEAQRNTAYDPRIVGVLREAINEGT